MKIILPIIVLSLIGCVSIPIPPTGSEPGSLGTLEIRMMFYPNVVNALEKLRLNKPQSEITPK